MKIVRILCLFLLPIASAYALDDHAERYVRLALEFGEHDADYVDAYLGPEEWLIEARERTRSKEELAVLIDQLLVDLEEYTPTSSELVIRHRALLRNVRAMSVRMRIVQGESVSFAEEARLIYDVILPEFDFSEFDRALREIEQLFPGEGNLADRVDSFQRNLEIPDDIRDAVIDLAIAECRRRTNPYISLPASERFTIEYVTGESWSGYNWYQGQNESLLQINIDFPIRIGSAVSLGCHEGYPGHHVWNVLVEKELLRENGWVEFSLFPLFSPYALIAEGSAEYGIDLAFPGDERIDYERTILFPAAGLDPERAETLDKLRELTLTLEQANAAIAQQYLDGDISREEAIEQVRKYGLRSRERAERSVRFMEQYRSYVLNYGIGEKIIRNYIEHQGDESQSRWEAFERMLTELYSASDMVN
jgi:hypothetical protein